MAKTSSASIGVTVTGDGEACTYVPPGSPMVNPAAPNGGTVAFILAAGANTFAIPTGSTGVVISPPINSTNAKLLQGLAGDVGIIIAANSPLMLTFGAGQASFDINSAGIETLAFHWL